MIFCFDTSALNEFHDDAEREPLVAALLSAGSVLISAYNVVEAMQTKDEQRRVSLVKLMRRLTRNTRMLDRPSNIVRMAASAFASKTGTFHVNADPKLDGLWAALNYPDGITDNVRLDATRWLRDTTGDLNRITAADRDKLKALFASGQVSPPRSAAATIREFFADRERFFRWFEPKYRDWTGDELRLDDLNNLLEEPVYGLFFGAGAYGIYQRAVRQRRYSRKHHANLIDLEQAVYLTLCDKFITSDVAQYRALRLLSRCTVRRKTEVLLYSSLRRRLFVA